MKKDIEGEVIIEITDASLLRPLPIRDKSDDLPCESISCMKRIDGDVLDEITSDYADEANGVLVDEINIGESLIEIDAFDEESPTLFMDDEQEEELLRKLMDGGDEILVGEPVDVENSSSMIITGELISDFKYVKNTHLGSASLNFEKKSFIKKIISFFKRKNKF